MPGQSEKRGGFRLKLKRVGQQQPLQIAIFFRRLPSSESRPGNLWRPDLLSTEIVKRNLPTFHNKKQVSSAINSLGFAKRPVVV
jgi:hypothetical protein